MTPLLSILVILLNLKRWLPLQWRNGSGVATTTSTGTKLNKLQYAILVDTENISHKHLRLIVNNLLLNGVAHAPVRRVYGDFSRPSLSGWRKVSLAQSFVQIHTPSLVSGKGTADAAMIIDAMDILHTNANVNGFCLVTSDSDFTSLAMRLRESGKHVVGFGNHHTVLAFRQACERFVCVDDLGGLIANDSTQSPGKFAATVAREKYSTVSRKYEANGQEELAPQKITLSSATQDLIDLLKLEHLAQAKVENDGWVQCGSLGSKKRKDKMKKLGYSKLETFLQDHPNHFEIRKDNSFCMYMRPIPQEASRA